MDGSRTKQDKAADDASLHPALCDPGTSLFRLHPREDRAEISSDLSERFRCSSSFTHLPEGLSNAIIFPEDRPLFNRLYRRILDGESTACDTIRSLDLHSLWIITLTAAEHDETGCPVLITGAFESAITGYLDRALPGQIGKQLATERGEKEEDEVMTIVSAAISTRYDALYHIWIGEDAYLAIREQLASVIDTFGRKGCYSEATRRFIAQYVVPEDRAATAGFFDITTLDARLRHRDTIFFNYRRIGLGWAQARYIVGRRDAEGKATNVIFTVSNINDEVERQERQKKDAYEAEHDPLTGLYNRKGFRRIIGEDEFSAGRTGFILVDIDNFKALNDCHGHELGDQVLSSVANELSEAFRSDDRLFRMGGDEIAILLHDCASDAWPQICAKFKRVHSSLAKKYDQGLSVDVTLSAGLCFSDDGYSTALYQLADEALYETKQNGRAGCSLINSDHRVINSWHDDDISLKTENALQYLASGPFRMELPIGNDAEPRLITGENTRLSFGLPAAVTAEECFRYWKKGVVAQYWPMLKKRSGR